MNRKDMITDLRGMGYNYKFYKYNDKQIYRMHQKALEKKKRERSSSSKSNTNLQELFSSVYGRIKND